LDEIAKIISMAIDNSINLIDAAISYCRSQRKLGLVGLDQFQVVTILIFRSKEYFKESALRI